MGAGCSKSSPENVTLQPIVHPDNDITKTTRMADSVMSAVDPVEEYEEFKVSKIDLGENEMKVVETDNENEVLLVKSNGQYYAVGTKCPHYGAPLVKGTVCNGKVRCPWHGACFSLETGDVEDFPSIDGIPRFEVQETEQHFVIRGKKSDMKLKVAVKPMAKYDHENDQTVVIVGGGGAGFSCADVLRKEGFRGRVLLVTKEAHLPYDRPKLSKAMTVKAEDIALKPEEYFKNADIEVMSSVEVTGVNTAEKWVLLSDGKTLKYTALVIAVGGRPREISFPGSDLKNIFYLRSPEDANLIAESSKGKNVVIYGASFIGMETAAYLVAHAASVTVVGRDVVPFRKVLGEQIGLRLKALHEANGVKFHLGTTISECHGSYGMLKEVRLADGSSLNAEVLLIGVGVVPATGFLKGAGIDMDPAGNVVVNEYLQSSNESIYAAGDIANFPLKLHPDSLPHPTVIGHWSMALSHGRNVALNILGKKRAMKTVPFFWTQMFGKSIRYAGHAPEFDDILIRGSVADLKFVAYFIYGDRALAVATLNADPSAAAFADSLTEGRILSKTEISELPDLLL